jgi:CBS domain-containing protein
MNVEQLMTRPVRTCRPLDTLNDAAQSMWEGDFGCVPVLGDTGQVVGLITDRDIAMAAYTQGKALVEIQVADAMSRDVHTCRAEDSVVGAEATMRQQQIHRLPVTDAMGYLLGIISTNDIILEAARERERADPSISLGEVGLLISDICQHRGPVALVAQEKTASY